MKKENAIEVKHVSKKFKIYLDKGKTLKEITLFSKRRRYEERSVLEDVSFDVRRGEAIGLIGQNGCGKSTTLKLLTRIMYPNSGSIEMKGRVSSLIELGAGFHPDMSGRQNIYTNAAIFGLTRKEIDKRLDDIIAFSELEEFIDNPVRTYSSGMYMRLAFSVAINVDADILLIDEILAVGDANFQAKCFNKLREIKSEGTTIVIVSHALGQIEQICERSIWIYKGKIKADGTPREIHPQYLDFMGKQREGIIEKEQQRQKGKEANLKKEQENPSQKENQNHEQGQPKTRWGNGDARIMNILIVDDENKKKGIFKTGEILTINVKYHVKRPVHNAVFGIGIFRSDGIHCYGTNTQLEKMEPFDLREDGEFSIRFCNIELMPGEYFIDLAIEAELGLAVDYFSEACKISIYSDKTDVGMCRLNHSWKLSAKE